ncbi:MAG: hypothetical protein ACRDNF_20075 [Streptosporangiaceae bacterium]
MSMTSAAPVRQLGPAEACPSWCAHTSEPGHGSAYGETHISTDREVPVLAHWWCTGAEECAADDGIVTCLIKNDGEPVAVGLRHGSDVLPHMDSDAAEQVGRALLELARQARA